MSRRGGRIGQGTNKSKAIDQPRGNSQRVPQRGPLKEKNAKQQSLTFDLNPHKFTRPSVPQPEQLTHHAKKKKAA